MKKKGHAVPRAPSRLCLYFIYSNSFELAVTTAGMAASAARMTSAPTARMATTSAPTEVASASARCVAAPAIAGHAARTAVARRTAIATVSSIRGAANDGLMHIQLRTGVSATISAGVAP